jgi:hypothetical protein
MPSRREILSKAFDRALRGPFNNLRPAGSQQLRLSESARFVFISTSTVCGKLFNYLYNTHQTIICQPRETNF